eukprot:CAMPEP_0172535898 /NCGR_PEP_ID=MMETSP1067-20121228/7722_1 /TAXON_ID=265564 ORGANISM="Thalassiosira punctigera, Strain Tpunct2005C2" /NCGR_SAMPLE_ID=MMETSP1067 /ASSEMBLY_ACC=CAM_ASM_000444 /LENGTH=77 /DNA_ID=CAMNT_0013320863 /DNA_START=1526 /DNA_END=1759 /DNA_ORIENTATION=+
MADRRTNATTSGGEIEGISQRIVTVPKVLSVQGYPLRHSYRLSLASWPPNAFVGLRSAPTARRATAGHAARSLWPVA